MYGSNLHYVIFKKVASSFANTWFGIHIHTHTQTLDTHSISSYIWHTLSLDVLIKILIRTYISILSYNYIYNYIYIYI